MRPLRTLTIDDEPLALRRLELILADIPEAQLVGSANSCAQAHALITERHPDLLLLDIRMRDGTGFDVLKHLEPGQTPQVVFVTAFDQYAIRAFEHCAVDYLLKPIEEGRLRQAISRAANRSDSDHSGSRIEELNEVVANLRAALREKQPERDPADVWIRSANGSLTRVSLHDVDWVSSEDDYVCLHVGHASYLLRQSIRALEVRLDASEFVRVHRSALVRLSSIAEIQRISAGRRNVVLGDGTRVPTGRVYFRTVRERLAERDALSSE